MKTKHLEPTTAAASTQLALNPPGLAFAEFGDRIVTLCDGRAGLRSGLRAEVRVPETPIPEPGGSSLAGSGALPILDFVSSTEALDRYDEVISAGGWRLDHYRRNPVFQNAHQYGDIIFTLGKALVTEVRAGGPNAASPHLFQRIQFATDINPMARIAYGLYKEKFLNAVSVGFIPIRWEDGAGDRGASEREAAPRRRYLEQELLEVSAVGIPANPEALQLGMRAGAIQRTDLRELIELLGYLSDSAAGVKRPALAYPSDFRSHPAVPNTHACASGVRGNEAQLLQLARALRELLRRT